MRWLLRIAFSLAVLWSACDLGAAEFKMSDGSMISGELVAPNDDGSVIRRTSGGLTSRMSWDKFSQETLRDLAKDPKLKEVVEAFIDLPESADPAAQAEIVVKQPPGKIARPTKRPGFFSALTTPAGGFILLIIFLANLYAAYEVSVFRNYPVAAVMGTSVILPVLGPILFLFMPTRVNEDVEVEAQFEAPQEVANTGAQELAAAGLAGSGLSLSAGAKHGGAPAAAQAVSYKRGEVEFSRTFFEKTFPLFFRLTRTDADKDSTLSIRSSKGEVVATRISRISANEIGLMTQQGREVQLRFADITEVHLKPKAG